MAGVFSSSTTKHKNSGVFSDMSEQALKGAFADKPQTIQPPIKTAYGDIPVGKGDTIKVANPSDSPLLWRIGNGIKNFVKAVPYGIGDALTLGALRQNQKDVFGEKNKMEQAINNSPAGNVVGQAIGYLAPGSVAEKGAGLLIKGATLLPKLARGAVAGGAIFGGQSAVEGDKPIDIVKNTALGGAFGVGGEVAGIGISKGINKLGTMFKPKAVEEVANIKPSIVEPVQSLIKPSTLNNKFSLKNVPLEKAKQEYDSAINTIQNHFGTDQLRSDELKRIQPELNINIPKLIKKYEVAEKTSPSELLNNLKNNSRMKTISGISNDNVYNSLNKVINSPSKSSILDKTAATAEGNLANTLPDTTSQIVSSYQKKPLLSRLSPSNIWEGMNNFYTKTVNDQRPISRADQATGMLASNSRNAQGTVTHILNNNLVDMAGNTLDKPLKDIATQIPKGKENQFMDYLLHKHNVDRMVQEKPVFGNNVTSDISKAKVTQYEKANPEFKAIGDNLNNWMNKFSNAWGVDSGMVSNELSNTLKEMYPNYVPTNRSFNELEKGVNYSAKKGYVNQNNGIKKATGSGRPVINPLESIMRMVDKTVKTSRYNEVGQSLLNAVRNNPEQMSRWAEIVPTQEGLANDINKTLTDEGINGLDKFHGQYDNVFPKKDATGTNIVTVMENGKPVQIQINDKRLLDSLTGLNNANIGPVENLARKLTNPYKALITSDNPIFAIRNVARDVPTAYVNGSVHNPLAFAKNYLGAYKDMITNAKPYQEYKALGGGESNFFANDVKKLSNAKDELINPSKNIIKKPLELIRKFNNATETAPRYAEYKATVQRGGGTYVSKQQGLFNANDITTNFARNGRITKAIDSGVPYLNPGVQGLDKTVRQFLKHPISTTLKGTAAITAPTLTLDYVNKNNPDYQNLDNRTKDNYFLIPKGDGTFFKLPKSRELGVLFGSLEQRLMRSANGEKDAFKGFFKNGDGIPGYFASTVATNFAPSNPIESNILSPVIYNIPKNKDFANRTIVPQGMQDLSPRYQYDEKTSEIAKKIGNLINYSPKKVDYLIKSYTGAVGQLGLPMVTKGGNPVKAVTSQFTADPMYSNNTIDSFYNNIDTLKQSAADKNFTEKIPSKVVTPEERLRNQFTKASTEMSKVRKQISLINSGNLPQDQKDTQTRSLQQKIIDLANKTNSMVK